MHNWLRIIYISSADVICGLEDTQTLMQVHITKQEGDTQDQ